MIICCGWEVSFPDVKLSKSVRVITQSEQYLLRERFVPPHEPSRSSSYFVLIHLDNFWSYRALFSWFFITNEDLWGFSHCLGLSFCIKCDGAKQMTFINAEVVMESSRNFRKLPRRSLSFLGCTLVAWTCPKHDLGVWPRGALGLTNDTRFCVHYQNGLVNVGFISIVWANT